MGRGRDPTGTGYLEKEVEVRGASLEGPGRRQAWRWWFINRIVPIMGTTGQSQAGLSPEQGDLVSCFSAYKRRRQWEVEK